MKKHVYFNFYAYKSLEKVTKMYDVINLKGRKKSEFIANAFQLYKQNQDIPEKTLSMINNINLLKYVTIKYSIEKGDTEKIKNILESINYAEDIPKKEMNTGRMTLSYETNDEIGMEICDYFNKMNNIDKVFKLVDIVSNYVETGYDEDYLNKESEELLKNLAALYAYSKDDKTLNEIVKTISIPFEAYWLPSYVKCSNVITE